MEENTKSGLKESHARHMDPFIKSEEIFKSEEEATQFISEFMRNGQITTDVITEFSYNDNPPYVTKIGGVTSTNLSFPRPPFLALVAACKETQSYEFITIYPYLEGLPAKVKVLKVVEWSEKLEATVKARFQNGSNTFDFWFFAADYFANKDQYKIGNEIEISLAASGNVEAAPKGFEYRGQQAVNFLKNMGREPIYDDNGNVEPVYIGMSNLVAFMPDDDQFPDMAAFQSPVSCIREWGEFMGNPVRTGIITLDSDTELKVSIYFNGDCSPEKGEGIRGVIWLSGHLYDDTIQSKVTGNRLF